jgi:serine-type D-Ala-D-Ala carboxypeptidase/endopeptidase (penicillin-binding protein 4)
MAPKKPLSLILFSLALCAARPALAECTEASWPQDCADSEGDQDDLGLLSAEPTPEISAPLLAPAAGRGEAHPFDGLVRDGLGDGNWGVEFDLVGQDGQVQVLSRMNEDKPLMPASTMKVFTSWFGFTENLEKERDFPPPYRSYEAYAATMLKFSVNPMAVKMLSLYGGASEMESFYAGLGLPVESFRVVDGAGLSVKNRATAGLEAALLQRIRASERYPDFRVLLAEPGEAGTLRGRLIDLKDKLFAKTGTLTRSRVAALTGFLETGAGGTIIFSIIGNNARLNVGVQRSRIDRTVEAVQRAAVTPDMAVADATAAVLRQKAFAAALPEALALP